MEGRRLPVEVGERRPAVVPGWAARVDELALALSVEGPPAGWRPVVCGLRLRVTDEALRIGLAHAATVLNLVSRAKVDAFLDQLSASPWPRSLRWSYASLVRLAAVESGLDVDGQLEAGAVVVRARFRPAADRGLLGQLRDLAKGAVTVTLRVEPGVGDAGRLRLRLGLEPDVRGLAARALVGALAKRPGVHRLDDATVEVDLGLLAAQEAKLPFDWEAAVRAVDVTPDALTVVFGPRDAGVA